MHCVSFCYNVGCSTAQQFWIGWMSGSLLIGGGKLWTILFDPQVRVSTLMGHIGTPLFRRQLAVGLATYALTSRVFESLREKLSISPQSISGKIYFITTNVISVSLGCALGMAVNHAAYHGIFVSIALFSIISALYYLKQQHSSAVAQ